MIEATGDASLKAGKNVVLKGQKILENSRTRGEVRTPLARIGLLRPEPPALGWRDPAFDSGAADRDRCVDMPLRGE